MTNQKHNAKGRSTGVQRGRIGRLNKPPAGEGWIWKTVTMLESEAFRALSINARKALDRIILEQLHHGGTENGALICTYDDFEAFGVTRRYIADTLRELRYFGVIRYTTGKSNGIRRPPHVFRLTWLPSRDGVPATNDWKAITSEHVRLWQNKRRRKRELQSKDGKNISPDDKYRPSKATNVVKSPVLKIVKPQKTAIS